MTFVPSGLSSSRQLVACIHLELVYVS